MKKDSKKSHDAPLRLFVCPFHTALTAGWEDHEGNLHDGQPVWHGMAVRMGRDDEEYINLGRVWHSVKEEPEDKDGMIILVDCNFEEPILCDLDVLDAFCDNEETMWKEATDNYQEGFWVYIKDIVPTKLKKGGK